MMTLKILEWEP